MTESERIWASLINALEIQYNVKINYTLKKIKEEERYEVVFGKEKENENWKRRFIRYSIINVIYIIFNSILFVNGSYMKNCIKKEKLNP